MTISDDLFVSVHASDLAGLHEIYRIATRYSIMPPGFDPLLFEKLPPNQTFKPITFFPRARS